MEEEDVDDDDDKTKRQEMWDIRGPANFSHHDIWISIFCTSNYACLLKPLRSNFCKSKSTTSTCDALLSYLDQVFVLKMAYLTYLQ